VLRLPDASEAPGSTMELLDHQTQMFGTNIGPHNVETISAYADSQSMKSESRFSPPARIKGLTDDFGVPRRTHVLASCGRGNQPSEVVALERLTNK
jgi:hypothetical protein